VAELIFVHTIFMIVTRRLLMAGFGRFWPPSQRLRSRRQGTRHRVLGRDDIGDSLVGRVGPRPLLPIPKDFRGRGFVRV
jgi:hypothetical protein